MHQAAFVPSSLGFLSVPFPGFGAAGLGARITVL